MNTKQFPVIDPIATGKNIIRLRVERGMSVRDLQAYFGFEEPQAIYKWQQGKSLPSVDNKAESSLAVSNIMSGLFLKAPELVLRNLLYLSEKCKQICLAADTYEVQIAPRFRLFPSLPTVLRHSERNSSFDKSQWQPPRRVLPNFSKLFSFVKDMQKSVPSDTPLRNRMIAALEKRHTSPKTHKTKETWLPVCSRKRNKSKR